MKAIIVSGLLDGEREEEASTDLDAQVSRVDDIIVVRSMASSTVITLSGEREARLLASRLLKVAYRD